MNSVLPTPDDASLEKMEQKALPLFVLTKLQKCLCFKLEAFIADPTASRFLVFVPRYHGSSTVVAYFCSRLYSRSNMVVYCPTTMSRRKMRSLLLKHIPTLDVIQLSEFRLEFLSQGSRHVIHLPMIHQLRHSDVMDTPVDLVIHDDVYTYPSSEPSSCLVKQIFVMRCEPNSVPVGLEWRFEPFTYEKAEDLT